MWDVIPQGAVDKYSCYGWRKLYTEE